jgi:hypothetical protein
MKAQAIINRFVADGDPTPGASVTGVEQLGYVHHFHLWQEGEPVDAKIENPPEWGKGEYPVNWQGLSKRTEHIAGKMPICLEMEIGPSTYDFKFTQSVLPVMHVGAVSRRLGRVDCVYGQGWKTDNAVELDIAAYILYGCPDRLAVPLYGGWSPNWGAERKHPIERAKRLADSITFKDVRLALFISPLDLMTNLDMDFDEWRKVCRSTRSVCEQFDCDVVLWWDGGPSRPDYAEAEPHVAVFREVFTGFGGITKGGDDD